MVRPPARAWIEDALFFVPSILPRCRRITTGDRNGNRVPDPEEIGIRQLEGDGDERHLGIHAFDDNTRLEAYERQHGVCPLCGAHFELSEMEADHITPWRDGGRNIPANCQMLCRDCNRRKGAK